MLALPCKNKDSGFVAAITIVSDYQIILGLSYHES